jgi:hypothetical protein
MWTAHNDTGEEIFPAAAHELQANVRCCGGMIRWHAPCCLKRAAGDTALRLKMARIASNYVKIIRVFCSLI